MNAIIVIGLTTAGLLAGTGLTFLILVRAGIGRQERAASLASRPRGLAAALTRRVLDLHASPPGTPRQRRNEGADAGRRSRGTRSGTP